MLKQDLGIRPIDKLGVMDTEFGLMPALAAILRHNEKEFSTSFDISEFVTKMRQLMALEECFCSLNYEKSEQELNNITKPDYLLFDKRVINNKLPAKFLEKIFLPLINTTKHLLSYNYLHAGRYLVKKNRDFINNKPYVVKEIEDSFYLRNKISSETLNWKNSPIDNPDSFIDRVELTCELFDELQRQNTVQFASLNFPNLEPSRSFDELWTLPLIGTIRNFPNQTVLYVMTYFQSHDRDIKLEQVNVQLDHVFPKIIQHHSKIKEIINKCAKMCRPMGGHECYITKMLARPFNSTGLCVVFFITFLKDIKMQKQERFPLKQLSDHARKNLKWEVYMKHLSYKKFPIREDEG